MTPDKREGSCCRLSIAERTASAVTVYLNLDLVIGVGVPVGRFSLVAVNDVRAVCP